MSDWKKLIDISNDDICRGGLLKFDSDYPFEKQVIMMFCEVPNELGQFGLIAITGSKAGINPYFVFPEHIVNENKIKDWLIENWYNFSLNHHVENAMFRSQLHFMEI